MAFFRPYVESDLVVHANAQFANLAEQFHLKCGLGCASISIHFLDKNSVVRPYLRDLLAR